MFSFVCMVLSDPTQKSKVSYGSSPAAIPGGFWDNSPKHKHKHTVPRSTPQTSCTRRNTTGASLPLVSLPFSFRLHTLSLSPPLPRNPTAAQTSLLNSRLRELPLDCLPHHVTKTDHKALNLNKLQTNHRCLTVLQPLCSSSFPGPGSHQHWFLSVHHPTGLSLPF